MSDEEQPWNLEPNRLEADFSGFKILILRHPNMGHLCGYVGLPLNHPLAGQTIDQLDYDTPLIVHGGFTFSEEGDGKDYPKGYWWIGFDCAHPSDFIPYDLNPHTDPVNYRDLHFVLDECLKLARRIQLVYGK